MAWRDEHFPGSPYVFPGKNGEMRKDCTAVDRFRKAAGLPPKFRPFHGLRHHFAVSLANSGKFSMDMISEMLTHKNVDFTKKSMPNSCRKPWLLPATRRRTFCPADGSFCGCSDYRIFLVQEKDIL